MPRPQPHLVLVACVTSSSSSSSSSVSWFNTWLIYRCPFLSAILCVCPWCTQGLWHYTTIFLLCFILPYPHLIHPTCSIRTVQKGPVYPPDRCTSHETSTWNCSPTSAAPAPPSVAPCSPPAWFDWPNWKWNNTKGKSYISKVSKEYCWDLRRITIYTYMYILYLKYYNTSSFFLSFSFLLRHFTLKSKSLSHNYMPQLKEDFSLRLIPGIPCSNSIVIPGNLSYQ